MPDNLIRKVGRTTIFVEAVERAKPQDYDAHGFTDSLGERHMYMKADESELGSTVRYRVCAAATLGGKTGQAGRATRVLASGLTFDQAVRYFEAISPKWGLIQQK